MVILSEPVWCQSIHPSSIPLILWGSWGVGANLSWHMARGGGGGGCTNNHTVRFTLKRHLDSSSNLSCMYLHCGRSPWEKTHTDTGRTCKLHSERPSGSWNPVHICVTDVESKSELWVEFSKPHPFWWKVECSNVPMCWQDRGVFLNQPKWSDRSFVTNIYSMTH